jgi:proteasome lid subunit RPN8/RPN11
MGLLSRKSKIKVVKTAYQQIIEHAKEAYPNECCGALVGHVMGGRKVFSAERMTNTNTDRAHDRYVIDPHEFNLIDKVSRSQGCEIIGFYHSHPDHPNRPSEEDRKSGQLDYSYIIVSVQGGTEVSAKCWIFNDEKAPFSEEKIELID